MLVVIMIYGPVTAWTPASREEPLIVTSSQ